MPKCARWEPLPPGLLVGEELAEKASLREAPSRDQHGTPIRFEEEVPLSPVLSRAVEPEPKTRSGSTPGRACRRGGPPPASGRGGAT